MESWRLLETWDAEPGFNMGLDEALLLLGGERPVLRFYTWSPAALSLGYFQRFDEVPAARRAPAVVRRLTGGGAIHHDRELTFSIAAPEEHPLYRGPVASSYERVHAAIAEALDAVGVRADLRGDAEPLRSDRGGTGMCFHASTPLDLVWDGAKGVGSAQRRTGGRVLHHGSIKLGTTELEGEIATLESAAPERTPRSFAPVLLASLGRAVGARFDPSEPSPTESEHARRRAPHFGSASFLHRR